MGGLFGGGSASAAPAPLPAPPAITDPEIEAARKKRLVQQSDMRGREATLLTGDGGDTTLAPTSSAVLLGR